MRVRADDEVAGHHEPLLREQSVLHAHLPHLEIVFQFLLRGELAQALALLRGPDVLVRREMVRNKRHAGAVEDLFDARLAEFLYGDGRRDVVAQHHVHGALYELAGLYLVQPRVRG